MYLTDELSDNSPIGSGGEQAVIICLQFPIGKLQEKKARSAIEELHSIFHDVMETSGIGLYNGYEMCEGPQEESVTFYFFGEDARTIYHEIYPILDLLPSLSGFYIIKRYSSLFEDRFPL